MKCLQKIEYAQDLETLQSALHQAEKFKNVSPVLADEIPKAQQRLGAHQALERSAVRGVAAPPGQKATMSSSMSPALILSSMALIDMFSSTTVIRKRVISWHKNLYPYSSGRSLSS